MTIHKFFNYFTAIFLLMLQSTLVFAQSASIKSESDIYKPNVILFMLHVSTNKIDALERRGLKKDVLLVKQADKEINTSIIKDFSVSFSFCPVYFFYENQLEAVLKKDWDNVTFYDIEHLTSPKKIEAQSFGNYFIAEVNYPPNTNYKEIKADSKAANQADESPLEEPEYANSRDYGILLYDDNFKLLPGKLRFTNIALRQKGSIFNKDEREYFFSGAEKFDKILKKFFKM